MVFFVRGVAFQTKVALLCLMPVQWLLIMRIIFTLLLIYFMQLQPNAMEEQNKTQEIITLGAGCFWCTEAVFQQIPGVTEVRPGYSGGQITSPSYSEVTSGLTGHAEVVQLVFDPDRISLARILEIFWRTHDPTTLNRQGADVGTQYRSVIFYHSEAQKEVAHKLKEKLEMAEIWSSPIVTEITAFEAFYVAEDYHHNYFQNNPNQPYCQFVIVPKLEKFKKLFSEYEAK